LLQVAVVGQALQMVQVKAVVVLVAFDQRLLLLVAVAH
jgi:hypothetical protein